MARWKSLFLFTAICALLLVPCFVVQAEAAGNRTAKEPYVYLDLAELEKIWSQPPKDVEEQIQSREKTQAIYSKYDGKRVVIEGEYRWGFEISNVGVIWIEFPENPDRKLLKAMSRLGKKGKAIFDEKPFSGLSTCRARIFGVFECKKGEMYGHMGASDASLLVEMLEILPDKATASSK